MKTLTEKWDYYKSLIDEREKEFVKMYVPDPPKRLYEVSPNGSIRILEVEQVTYFSNKRFFRNEKRASTEQVLEIQHAYNNPEDLNPDNIRLHWRSDNSSSAIKISDIPKYFLTEEDAQVKSDEREAVIQAEEQLIANGHVRCERCRKPTPQESIVTKNIIGRGRKQVYDSWKHAFVSKACITETLMKFCSGTCAAHEQMSREG